MAESTLTYTFGYLKSAIGDMLGYGYGADYGARAWNAKQIKTIEDTLRQALNMVYTPAPLRPGMPSHRWTWLRPFAALTTTAGQDYVTLPDDFGGLESDRVHFAEATRSYNPIAVVTDAMLETMARQSGASVSGVPRVCAEYVVKGTTLTSSSRYQLKLYPTPDAVYHLSAQYKFQPNMLDSLLPYPPGGAACAELFRAAALAAAESTFDRERGVYAAAYAAALEAAMNDDNLRKGAYLGYNGDRSDSIAGAARFRRWPYDGFPPPVIIDTTPV